MLRLRLSLDGEDRFFALTGDRLRLGRGSDNDIVLSDVSVSRYHAEIRRGPEGWAVHDLKSTNGVELNQAGVEKAVLRPGDHLGIGVFQLQVEAVPDPTPVPPTPLAVPIPTAMPAAQALPASTLEGFGNATIIRPLADFAAAYGLAEAKDSSPYAAPPQLPRPDPDRPTGELVFGDRMFGFLTRLARILIVAESLDEVLARVTAIAFEALPIDRGFILLSDSSGELVCELARFKDRVEMRPQGEVAVSRTMLRAVMRERVALVTFDAQSDQRLSGGESIRLHQIRAAMCVPLWSGDRIIGAMQVDSPFQVGAFGERDLDFFATLANFVAVAVERIRYARQAEMERQVRNRLERYHSPAVIEEMLQDGAGSRRLKTAETTVLFADLVGFTTFSETSPPEKVAELLGTFLNLAVEAIFRAGGTLDKFIGDCVMAFFGAPVPQPDHALRAVRAAMEIQQGLEAWSAQQSLQGQRGFAARVALNSGPVVVGDVGSVRRVDYTVLGNTVNVAARLEAHVARPGDVVLGPETYRLLSGAVPAESLGELQLKGLQQKIVAYRVLR